METPSEREFIERRLEIVEKRLKEISEYEIDADGHLRLCYQSVPTRDYALIREENLLKKLNQQVSEKDITKALKSWRKSLGKKLHEHREYYRPLQEEHDRWYRLPFPTRIEIPEPPHPPELEVTDYKGVIWFIDDTLLRVLDDLNERLQKWMEY